MAAVTTSKPGQDLRFRGVIGLLAACLLPWAVMHVLMVPNADNLWLAEGYRRWSGGAGLVQSFFEVNPPLSLLLYALPVEFAHVSGLALHQAIFLYTGVTVLLAAAVLWRLLKAFDFLSREARLMALAGFILSSTLLTTGFFGERDHFVAMALVLLLSAQYIVTKGYALDRRFLGAVIFISAFILLLKPHYLLLPAIILCARVVQRRSLLAVLRDRDGWLITAAVFCYAGVLYLFFQDYLQVILPVVWENYGLRKAYDILTVHGLQALAGAALVILLAFILIPDRATRRFIGGAMVMAALALVPYVMQGLGYAYHLLPATTLLWMGLGVVLYYLVLKQVPLKQGFALGLAVTLCAAGAYAAKMPQRSFISHTQFAQLPLVQAAQSCAAPPCTVFLFGPSFEISYLVSYYAQAQYASRFGALFFLPRHLQGAAGPQQIDFFRGMVVEDFKNYQPDIVMLARFEIIEQQGDFDLADYLQPDAGFKRLWQHYKRTGYIEAPFEDYIKDMALRGENVMRYDIYQRVP